MIDKLNDLEFATSKFTNNSFEKDIKLLIKRDNWHGWLALIEDYLVIGFAIFISLYISLFLLPLSILLIGSRQRALATILHEASHHAFTENKTLNYIMGTFLSGYLIFQTMGSYKTSHVHNHHGKFGDKEKDPDYKYAIDNGLYDTEDISNNYKHNIVYPLFLSKLPSYLKSLIQERLGHNESRKEALIFMGYWVSILAIFFYTDTLGYFLLFWILPYITSFNIIGWYIELSEHYPLMKNNDPLEMTRNRHSHPIEHFLTGMHNENYHLIHHLFPSIPFWNLPKAHAILMQDEAYRKIDDEAGGILLSKENRQSLITRIRLDYYKKKID